MSDVQPTQPIDPEGSPTMTQTSGTAVDTWRHPVNTGHLVMGIAFAGILAVWALLISDTVDADDLRWLAPLPWVLAGAVGLVVATQVSLRGRRDRSATD